MKKHTHGGKRKGAGGPKKEPTKVMRIPVSKVSAVKELIRNEKYCVFSLISAF